MNHVSKATIRNTLVTCSLLMLAAAGITPAAAAGFDGNWTVQIASKTATCGGGQSVSIGIANGQVASSSAMVTASGHVAAAGTINVVLKSGFKSASGIGRLSATSGAGTWHGDMCSGTWTAQRT